MYPFVVVCMLVLVVLLCRHVSSATQVRKQVRRDEFRKDMVYAATLHQINKEWLQTRRAWNE